MFSASSVAYHRVSTVPCPSESVRDHAPELSAEVVALEKLFEMTDSDSAVPENVILVLVNCALSLGELTVGASGGVVSATTTVSSTSGSSATVLSDESEEELLTPPPPPPGGESR